MSKKAKRALNQNLRNNKKERNSKLYSGWDIGTTEPYEVKRSGVTYSMEPAYELVADDYDEYLCSIEQSHREYLGYSKVVGYSGNTDHLDLTFIQPQDDIDFALKGDIKSIKLNFSNLETLRISSEKPVDFDVVLDCGLLETLGILKEFLENNSDLAKNINFQKIDNNLLKSLLTKACSKYGKTVTTKGGKIEDDISR